ncbi:MAG TPA: penicillin-binding transpeptidase domain-containing protein [Actinomycetota bacterium]
MDRQIRRLGVAFVVLFSLLFLQVAYIQVFAADRIANDPGNATRQIRAEYETERGPILASDGQTILADSVEAPAGSVYRFQREYPRGELYGHLTGFYSRVYGRTGLEQAMNPYLSGTAPELTAQNLTDLILGKPKKGGAVVTTIVPSVQQAAKQALGPYQGAVAAIDPRTGDVLALYSNPGFDPTGLSVGTAEEMKAVWDELNADPDKPLLSKAFQELYLPGSTFKMITASAALERGTTPDGDAYTIETQIANPHVLDLPTTDDDLHNFGDELCHGGTKTVSMSEAFRQSCNVPFGQLGLDIGPEVLAEQAFAYGFCRTFPPTTTTCEDPTIPFLLDVENGRFPDPSYFEERIPAIAYSAVGLDNDLTNPLHLALVAAAIGNGGTLYEPRLVMEIRDAQGQVVKTFAARRWGEPISPTTADEMRTMMVNVVENGTGYAASLPGTVVAGKTGTATNGEGVPPNAWFASFAPAGPGQTPRVAVAVIVLDGGDLGDEATGGRVAAPIAREVMRAALRV